MPIINAFPEGASEDSILDIRSTYYSIGSGSQMTVTTSTSKKLSFTTTTGTFTTASKPTTNISTSANCVENLIIFIFIALKDITVTYDNNTIATLSKGEQYKYESIFHVHGGAGNTSYTTILYKLKNSSYVQLVSKSLYGTSAKAPVFYFS